MEIVQHTNADITILVLTGRLDVTTTPMLEAKFDAVFASGAKKILIDCTELDYISSAGLRALLTAAKTAKKTNGRIVLASLNKNVKQIFEISGFTSIFDVYESGQSAISSF